VETVALGTTTVPLRQLTLVAVPVIIPPVVANPSAGVAPKFGSVAIPVAAIVTHVAETESKEAVRATK